MHVKVVLQPSLRPGGFGELPLPYEEQSVHSSILHADVRVDEDHDNATWAFVTAQQEELLLCGLVHVC